MQSLDQSQTQGEGLTIGTQAHTILDRHYHSLLKQQPQVLKDGSPEPLHRLRVTLRQLGTATEVFAGTIKLPKGARRQRLRSLRSALGKQRDLDVLLETLQQSYRPQLNEAEIYWLDQLISILERRRRKAHRKTQVLLTRSPFTKVQTAYAKWMEDPSYTQRAEFPLIPALPDLLMPLLSSLLLHPGWLVTISDPMQPLPESIGEQLHDLRKLCKRVRYQAEFFVDFYGENFHSWLEEIKTLQEGLGQVQDSQVLQDMLRKRLPDRAEVPQLWTLLQIQQGQGIQVWQDLRTRYLDPEYRRDLYQMILAPGSKTTEWGASTPGAITLGSAPDPKTEDPSTPQVTPQL